MRYGLLSTATVVALSFGVASGMAQSSSGGSSSGGGASGGSGTTMQPSTGSSTSGSPTLQSGSGTSGSGATATGTTGSTGSVTLTTQQRNQVRDAFRSVTAQPVDATFNVTVGAEVPTSVTTLQACPETVRSLVTGLPDCRYIIVRDQIVLVNPQTRRVVTVIERQG